MNTFLAELRKTSSLPGTAVGMAVAVLGTTGIAVLNATGIRSALASGHPDQVGYTSPVDAVFSAAPLGTVGAVVVGVLVVSSEYAVNSDDAGGGRQIGVTLTATPRRLRVLAAKVAVVVLVVAAAAVVALTGALVVATTIVGDLAPAPVPIDDVLLRSLGAGLYWTLTGLMALAATVVVRNGVLPLVVLIANSSLVSVSLLLSFVTPAAFYLPDLAGTQLFAGDLALDSDRMLDPVTGGLVMAGWTAALLAVAGVVLARRDA